MGADLCTGPRWHIGGRCQCRGSRYTDKLLCKSLASSTCSMVRHHHQGYYTAATGSCVIYSQVCFLEYYNYQIGTEHYTIEHKDWFNRWLCERSVVRSWKFFKHSFPQTSGVFCTVDFWGYHKELQCRVVSYRVDLQLVYCGVHLCLGCLLRSHHHTGCTLCVWYK